MLIAWLLVANLTSTWFMVGLIWFVQVVHYPSFSGIGPDLFPAYHAAHTRRTTTVVAVPMLIEGATAIALLLFPSTALPRSLAIVGVVLVLAIWLSTATLQVPQHNRLAQSFNISSHAFLCRTNWLRTILWSARGGLLAWSIAGSLTSMR